MTKVFLDTDIILDLFLDRQPHLENTRKIFQLASNGEIKLFTSVTTFTNIFYILSKLMSRTKTKEKLIFLEKRVNVLNSKHEIVKLALYSAFSDFEDGVQHYTALACGMDILLTRNIKDYKNSMITVKTTAEFLS